MRSPCSRTALVSGSWFVRRLQQIAPGAVVMHGHRHIDWIGTCGPLHIVSAPSPVMNAIDHDATHFYVHTLEAAPDRIEPPERIEIAGTPAEGADRLALSTAATT